MALGFKLGVDYSEASKARKELADLNSSMNSLTQGKPIDFGGGLEGASEALKHINQQVKHLQGLAKSGERQKGLLRVDQFKEASRLSKDIKGTFDSYYKSLATAENQLDRLISKRRKLISVREETKGFTSRREITGDIKSVDQEIKKLTEQLDKRFVRESRLTSQTQQATGRIGGMKQVGEGGGLGGMLGGGLKKAGGLGLALAGGFSIYNFIKDSISKEAEFATVEANLLMRGGKPKREGSYGYTPLQAAKETDVINKATGLMGDELNKVVKNVKLFARGRGASGSQVGGYVSEVYQATGFGYKGFKKLLKELTLSVKSGGVGGRVEEFLNTNRQIVTQLSRGVGGAELSPKTISQITDFQTRLWKQGGEIGRGESGARIMTALDQGIRGGGGTQGQQMFMYNAISGGGVKNFSDYYDFLGMQEQGMWGTDKEGRSNIEKIMGRTAERFGTTEEGEISKVGRLNLMKMFSLTTKQVDLLSGMFKEGKFKDLGETKKAVEAIDLKKDADKFMQTTGGRHLGVKADIDTLKLKIGKDLVPSIDKLKDRIISLEQTIEERYSAAPGPQKPLGKRFENIMGGGGYAATREVDQVSRKKGVREESAAEEGGVSFLDDLLFGGKKGRPGSMEEDEDKAIQKIIVDIAPDAKRLLEAAVVDHGTDF